MTFREPLLEYAPVRLIRTREPLRVPTWTYSEVGEGATSERESERMQELGSTSLTPQILLSSRRDWKAGPAGSEIPTITCIDVGRKAGKDDLEAYTIQVLNEPH